MSGNSDNNSSFLDPRTLIAIVVCAVVFFGWQTYMAKKYPDYYKAKTTTEGTAAPSGEVAAAGAVAEAVKEPIPTKALQLEANQQDARSSSPAPESLFSYENEQMGFEISSKGMGIQKIHLKKYFDHQQKEISIGAPGERQFEIGLVGEVQPLDFNIEKKDENTFIGRAQAGETQIIHTMSINPETSRIESDLHLQNVPAGFPGLRIRLSEARRTAASGTLFMPSFDHQEFIVEADTKVERFHVKDGEAMVHDLKSANLLAIGSQYFVNALVDESPLMPAVKVEAGATGNLNAQAIYLPSAQSDLRLRWLSYAGGKSLTNLQQINPELAKVVNFGFFGAIGKVLLKVLIWAHGLVGNWGWAIIILTVLVRLIVLPFNVASYRSMKKMQKIQPQLQALRERYKEDPTALNRETMALMREQKVNPLGGCLPIFLQMPVFFALYQVLGQSIELYHAPWILWIQDLSQKDPYYVLPVLMGVTMFVQQKITPTTMDPTQAKIMLWMPLIFSVFTFGLPAGLTLYIFVSTLFGVIQQQIFTRDRGSSTPAVGTKPAAR